MNCALVSKLKPLLPYLVPLAVISPSILWIALDNSVWTWDAAAYGKSSIELFYTMIFSPNDWLTKMLSVLHSQAPGVSIFRAGVPSNIFVCKIVRNSQSVAAGVQRKSVTPWSQCAMYDVSYKQPKCSYGYEK